MTGADGATGPVGPAGPTGPQGIQGIQGPPGPTGWALTGNAGTSATTNFIGTTDDVAVTIRTNSITGLRIAPGTDGSDPGTTVTPNVIGGDANNTIPTTVEGSTIGGGVSNSISAPYATIPGGIGASATQQGQMAYANGSFAAAGDAQASTYILRRTTTGNQSDQVLFLDGSALRLAVPTGKTWTFTIYISGRSTNGLSAGYVILGAVENVGGATSLVGTPLNVTPILLGSPGFEENTGWAADIVGNNTTDSLDVIVTTSGLGNGVVTRWVARVETVEVGTP